MIPTAGGEELCLGTRTGQAALLEEMEGKLRSKQIATAKF